MTSKSGAQRVTLEVKTPDSEGKKGPDRDDDDDDDEERPAGATAPLFDVAQFSDEITAVAVERIEPSIDEGYLGRMDPHASEGDLKSKWGGGRYHITARNGAGHIKAHRYLNIAGDPRFESKAARRRWKRSLAEETEDDERPRNTDAGEGMQAFLQLQMQMIREDAERRERADREERDRREREAREERERRDREQDARDRQARRDLEESRARDREHMQTMMTLVTSNQKNKGSDLDAFTRGIEMAMQFAGGKDDEDDPYGLKQAVAGLLKGMNGDDDEDDDDPVDTIADKTGVRITGPTADKMREFMKTAKERGVDPEKALDAMLDAVQEQIRKKRAAQPNAGQSAPAAPSPKASNDAKPAASADKKVKPQSDRDRKRAEMRARLKARIAAQKGGLRTTDRGDATA